MSMASSTQRSNRCRRRAECAAATTMVLAVLTMAATSARGAERVSVALPLRSELAAEDAARAAEGLPWRYALPQAVRLSPARDGRWETPVDGGRRWRLEIASPGARSLNLGFTTYWLPRGAVLSLRGAGTAAAPLVFDDGDNADHGELWTPIVPGDQLTVELFVPDGATPAPLLELGYINAGYRAWGDSPSAEAADLKSGACNVDVVCPEGDAWRAEIASVGLISVSGSYICSGAMVNNTAEDGRPYFLTANHCVISGTTAASVVVYWNFQSPVCGQHGGGSLAQFTSGSYMRASWPGSDFRLLELDELPDPAFGVTYAGWNRGAALPTSAVGIHQPDTDEKSISFENDPVRLTAYTSTAEPGDGTHLRVVDWDLGTTEPGSSGSPLFDQDHLVVGQLHGGYAACGNNESDWYGWFARSWDGGGTPDSRLMEWLDPGASGAVTVPLLAPSAGAFTVIPAGNVEASGPAGGPFTPSGWTFTLDNQGAHPASYTATVDQPWLSIAPTGGNVPAEGSTPVTLSFAAPALRLAPGRHLATVTLANPGLGSVETREVALEVVSNSPTLVSAGPNPFRDAVTVRVALPAAGDLTWRVFDLAGRQVHGPVTQSGAFGQNDIVWEGRDAQGRRLPSGTYVLSASTAGREVRATLVCAR